ncbi:hypothetical protein [Saccharopolyspora spinosa]|uniref:hypothetical protein n=1 Tax=Saccharopolyspora spinosa TaxID=60894 RepID=UPI0002378FB1
MVVLGFGPEHVPRGRVGGRDRVQVGVLRIAADIRRVSGGRMLLEFGITAATES